MDPIVPCILFFIVLSLFIVIYLWMCEYFALRRIMGYISGPRNFPFIGLSWKMARVSREDQFRWFNDLCFSFEKGMVVTWFGVRPVVNIRKPRQIEIILDSCTFLSKTKMYNLVTPWLRDGVLTSTDDTWFYRRQFIKSVLTSDALEDYVPVIYEHVSILLECIQNRLDRSPKIPINIFDIITKFTFDTICKLAMGVDIDTQRNEDNEYAKAFQKFCQIITDQYFTCWMKYNFIFYKTKMGREYLEVIQILRDFTEKVIKQKLLDRQIARSHVEINFDVPVQYQQKLFLDHLINTNEMHESPLTLEEMRQEVDTLIFTGYNSTSAAIYWTLFILGNAPKIQTKIHKELKQMLRADEMATLLKLNQLSYLDRVIKEALRLYPSVPSIGRYLDNDVVIDNFFIPKHTTINIQVYQLHHDPEIWKNPETFDPDRFLPENNAKRCAYSYIPFSAGPRNCIGDKFALMQIKFVLIAILRKWYISSVRKPTEIKMISNFTLKPSDNKIELYFKPIDYINV